MQHITPARTKESVRKMQKLLDIVVFEQNHQQKLFILGAEVRDVSRDIPSQNEYAAGVSAQHVCSDSATKKVVAIFRDPKK